MGPSSYTPSQIIGRLEEAGAALMALPQGGFSTQLRTQNFDIVRDVTESYGRATQRLRPPPPNASSITRMDEALGWLTRIPDANHVLRRIVGARALISPINGKHLYSWRQLALLLAADHKAIQRWHADGIGRIVASLNGAHGVAHGTAYGTAHGTAQGAAQGGARAAAPVMRGHDAG